MEATSSLARERAVPARFTAELAGWRCGLWSNDAAIAARLRSLFDHQCREGSASAALGVLREPEGEDRIRLRPVRGGEPCDLLASLSGPEWRRFVRCEPLDRRVYRDESLGGGPALEMDGFDVRVLHSDRWPLYTLLTFIGLMLHEHSVVSIHAGVCAYQGEAMVLVGPSGSGKSTLAWALQQRGAVCFGDEWAFFTRPDFRLHVLPRPLCLRPGGLEVIGAPPEGMEWHEARAGDPKCTVPVEGRIGTCPQDRVNLWFADGFGPEPEPRPISAGEATRRLLRGLSAGDPSLEGRLGLCADLVARFPCRKLRIGSPQATADLLLADIETRK